MAPLGLGYLASFARKNVPGVEIFIERDLQRLIDARPDLVGLTFVTFNANYAARTARQIKDALGVPIMVGGPHVSLLRETLDPAFDVAIVGEGEETFAELLTLFKARRALPTDELAKINGIHYRDDSGAVVSTQGRAMIADLDQLPFPDRASTWKQWPAHPHEAVLMTSRGCPYDCYFCSTTRHWGMRYRYASVDYVIREIEEVNALHQPKLYQVYDDLFVGRRDRTLQLLSEIRRRRLHEQSDFRCFVRANLLDDELMEAFAKSGFGVLNIGFESASEAVMNTFNKKSAGPKTSLKAIDLARKHGVKFTSTFIIGAPGETHDDIYSTFQFISDNADVFLDVLIFPLIVMPGTEVWEWARRIGVSEQNLTGIAYEPEDVTDEAHYFLNRWPFLNEENMSRQDIFNYMRVARSLSKSIQFKAQYQQRAEELQASCASLTESVNQLSKPSTIAANIPISEIVKEKALRRMRQLRESSAPGSDKI